MVENAVHGVSFTLDFSQKSEERLRLALEVKFFKN